jgi:3-hydroxyisobutyrate dehydrogenase
MNRPDVALLGLGLMGAGMAQRILDAGFRLAAFNRTREKAAALGAAGARVAASPRDAAAGADVVISMVADDAAARAVWLGPDGALAGVKKGAVCVESSTVTVGWVRELAAAAAARGAEFLDAPVTGSRTHAAAGELSFLVGGPAEALEKARPVLAVMSKTIRPLGAVGSGALMKLVNNFLAGVQVASLAQALAMIERGGLDRAQALEVLTSGAPGSPLIKVVAERMAAPDYTPHFFLQLMAKDLTYAVREAGGVGVDLTTASAALEAFHRAVDAGLGQEDMAAVVEPMRRA